MYAPHFGLTERPFSLAPDPRYLYLSAAHREALAHLLYGLGEGGSVVRLTGEVGTGKTTVCRALLEQLPPGVDVAMIFNPRLTAVELLATVCDELRVAYPPDTTSVKVLVDRLSQALLEAHGRGRRTVLIIDEAQNLSGEVLEEVRLLTNLETTRQKLLQVILIGQPELAELLARPEMRQLSQRITARYHLRPFTLQESRAYVQHRMKVAGQRRPIFDRGALNAAHHLARGIPRLLNTICDRALLGAYASEQSHVTATVVKKAAREVLGGRARRRSVATAVAAVVVAVAAAAAIVGLSGVAPISVEALRAAVRPVVAPTPPPVAAVAPQRREPTLAEILADPTVVADERSAYARLYAVWQVEPPARAGQPGCTDSQSVGLRCLRRAGTWTALRRLDVPAILLLQTSDGVKYHVVLTRLTGDRATIEIGERRVTAPTAEIEPYWDGAFVAMWRPPALAAAELAPGMRGKDVAWLRRRLAAIDGTAVAGDAPPVYDAELRRRVVAFQLASALRVDGIVGEETLLRLVTVAPEDGAPSLSRSAR